MIKKFKENDILLMKKKHPCGSAQMRVLRTGSDIKVRCVGCGHDVIIPRVKIEKNIKEVISETQNEQE